MGKQKTMNDTLPVTTDKISVDDEMVPVLCIYHIKRWRMFAIDLENISEYRREKEVLILPFPLVISKVKHKKTHSEIVLKHMFSNIYYLFKEVHQWNQAQNHNHN